MERKIEKCIFDNERKPLRRANLKAVFARKKKSRVENIRSGTGIVSLTDNRITRTDVLTSARSSPDTTTLYLLHTKFVLGTFTTPCPNLNSFEYSDRSTAWTFTRLREI